MTLSKVCAKVVFQPLTPLTPPYAHCLFSLILLPTCHTPFHFLLPCYQNSTHNSKLGLNPQFKPWYSKVWQQKANLPGKSTAETCWFHSCVLRFFFLKGTLFLWMVFSKCGLQVRVLMSMENWLKWKLLAPSQTYEIRNLGVWPTTCVFNKTSRWFWSLLKLDNHCLRESLTDHLWYILLTSCNTPPCTMQAK